MQKKLISLSLLLVTLLTFVGCNSSIQSNVYLDMINNKDSNKKILLLAESQSKDYPTTQGDNEFAKLVKEKTNGRIEVKVITGGGLGSEKDTLAQVRMGTIDFTRTSISPLSSYSDIMNVLSLPYLYRDSDHMWAVLNGSIGKQALEDIQKANLVGLAFYDSGSRNFYNNKREIKSVSDLKDLRIRVQESDLMKALVSSLGATPVAMDSAQVLQALALGQVDGAENNPATYFSSNQFNVAKYYTIDEHSRIPDILVGSKKVMDGISKEDQEIIKKAAEESVEVQKKAWKTNEDIMLDKMKQAGVKITQLDQSSKDSFKNSVTPVYEKFGSKYTDLIKQIDQTK
ncbi:TRAP transporter substrate-binding protein [Clostridium manihotivorum]|uniref:C4-dicarboxylate ABC transporter substrate-binding protein n=1 Tax=Clostridium manihotivorum TaxID=2320868 RepID=A0A3R5QWW6_9CLOT|nr:TRAP transporter substrate-binding protein [Clostridium manihotivorum]QAA31405.1 C4-dicarboxylate ABC transporter substrate-binding protein [Clostridium manihotivorum]